MSDNGSSTAAGTAGADPGLLPLLPPGKHLSMITGFDSYPAAAQRVVDARWDEALANGVDTGRLQVPWDELEPEPGRFDLAKLEVRLARMAAMGLQTFVTIKTLDSADTLCLPGDLRGKSFGDSEVLRRFRRLLTETVPLLCDKGVYCLSVGNEPAGYLSERPDETEPVALFIAEAREAVRKLESRLAVTMTMDVFPVRPWLPTLLDQCDVACVNYYCIDARTLRAKDAASLDEDMDTILEQCGSRSVIFQELGMPAGYQHQDSPMMSAPDVQKAVVSRSVSRLVEEPTFRCAYWFQLMDWSEQMTDLLLDVLRLRHHPPDWIARFVEWLRTSGLCCYQQPGRRDGSARPAWGEFLRAAKHVSATRPTPPTGAQASPRM